MNISSLGPTGGHGGQAFEDYFLPEGASIREIHVRSGWYVDAIQFIYTDATGQLEAMPRIGGGGGEHHDVFALGEDEHLTGISGRSGVCVDSIQFHTNKRTSPRFGGNGGENEYEFLVAEDQEVVGLHGRYGWYVDAIGVIVRPRAQVAPPPAPVAATKAPKPKSPPKAKKAAVKAGDIPAPKPEKTVAPVEKTAEPKAKKAAAKASDIPAPKSEKTAAPVEKSSEPKPADLQKVEGIGPKIADILVAAGVTDLDVLAATPVDRLKEILSGAGRRFAMADPTTWPEQAASAVAGDEEGLKALQAKLKAGRKA